MATVPVRGLVTVFWAMVRPTTPSPEPLAPVVTVIQAAELVAVQVQPAGALMLTLVDSPAAGEVRVVGLIA